MDGDPGAGGGRKGKEEIERDEECDERDGQESNIYLIDVKAETDVTRIQTVCIV